MKFRVVISLLVMHFGLFHFGLTQNNNAQYFFERYSITNGLSDNTVNDILKDNRGFLWLATPNGVNRFDGYEFRKYYHNSLDTFSIPSSWVNSLSQDNNGYLWIGCRRGGVAKYDHNSDRFIKQHLWFEEGYDLVNDIFCDNQNRIWVATARGHYLYENSGKLIKHWRKDDKPGSIPSDEIVHTFQDSKGRIWVGTAHGFCKYNEQTKNFTVYEDTNPSYTKQEGNGWVNSSLDVTEDAQGHFWFGGWATGLKHFNPETGQFEGWLPSPEFMGQGAFNIISGQHFYDGRLWIANHDKGLGVFDTLTRKFSFVKDWGIAGTESLHRQITELFISDSVLWIGGGNGLFKLDLRPRIFDIYKLGELRFGSCLTNAAVGCAVPNQPTKILFPTWTCGVYEYDFKTGATEARYFNYPNEVQAIERLDIKKVMYDSRGILWMPTHDGIIRIEKGKVLKIQPSSPKPYEGDYVEKYSITVIEDSEGNVWAGTLDGILLFPKGSKDFIKYKLSDWGEFPSLTDWIVGISVAPNDEVWFVRKEGRKLGGIGFTVYDPKTDQFRTFPLFPETEQFSYGWCDITIDSKGRLWLSTEHGLIVFNITDPQNLMHISSVNGLISENCYYPVEDASGNIWIASRSGLSVINPDMGTIKNVEVGYSLPDAEITSLFKTGDGSVCVGFQNNWLAVLRLDRMKTFGVNASMRFVAIEVAGSEIQMNDTINVNYDFGYIRMKYSPLNFLDPRFNTFHIQINNNNNQTKYRTDLNVITLSGLSPGIHNIQVYTENKFTGEKSRPTYLTLIVKPAFWQTFWFKGLILFFVFLFLGGFIWWRYRNLKIAQRKEISTNKRIAEIEMDALKSQMNPHFIFNALNAVHRFIWEKNPGDASEYLTKFARLIRMVLENSRQKWIPLTDDLRALEYYIQLESLHLENGLEYSIIFTEEIDPETVMVPPLILQPFVENSIKHGCQGKTTKGILNIVISLSGNELLCEIEDNGRGRMANNTLPNHQSLGTTITSDRLEIINHLNGSNARFLYEDKVDESGSPSGTKVRLYLPLIYD